MAAETVALPSKRRLAAVRVARLHRAAVEGVHVAKVRDDAGDFGRIERERLHPGTLDAGEDHAREILIGDGIPESPAAEIDSADTVAVRAVARRALGVVQPRAVRDVCRSIFTGMRG